MLKIESNRRKSPAKNIENRRKTSKKNQRLKLIQITKIKRWKKNQPRIVHKLNEIQIFTSKSLKSCPKVVLKSPEIQPKPLRIDAKDHLKKPSDENHKKKNNIRLETKSCRILPLTQGKKYDLTQFPTQ